ELGARTGFLLCTYPSQELIATHDVVIAPLVGPEVITGSTRMKAGTATKMVLNTITTSAMVKLGKVFGNLMVDLQVTCEKLRDRGQRILMETLGVDRSRAADLLERAGGHVKTAIVMGSLDIDRDEARRRLQEAGGVTARVVGDRGGGRLPRDRTHVRPVARRCRGGARPVHLAARRAALGGRGVSQCALQRGAACTDP